MNRLRPGLRTMWLAVSQTTRGMAILITSLVMAFCAIISIVVLTRLHNRSVEAMRYQVDSQIAFVDESITLALGQRLAMLEGLLAFTEASLESNQPITEDTARIGFMHLTSTTSGITAISIAPDGIEQFVYPLEENRQYVGQELASHLTIASRAALTYARSFGHAAVGAPFRPDLDRKFMGIYHPVYQNGEFWGWIAIIVDTRVVLESAGITPDEYITQADLNLAIRDSNGHPLAGDRGIFSSSPVIRNIDFPGGYWEVAAVPTVGWDGSVLPGTLVTVVEDVIILAAIAFITYHAATRQLKLRQAVNRRTAELAMETDERVRTEAILRSIFEFAPDAIFLESEDDVVVDANPAAYRLLGYQPGELLGLPVSHLIAPEALENRQMPLVMNEASSHVVFEGLDIRKDGTRVPVEVRTNSFELGNQTLMLSIVRDIGERIRNQKALAESEERLRLVIQNMPVMMVAFDENGLVVAWNRECVLVTGFSAEQIIGNPHAMEMLYPDPSYRAAIVNESQQRNGEYYGREWQITTATGERRWVSWSSISRLYPIPGWYNWLVGFDITERKLAEIQQAELTERLIRNKESLLALARMEEQDIRQQIRRYTETLGWNLKTNRVAMWLISPDHLRLVCEDVYRFESDTHGLGEALLLEKYPGFMDALNLNLIIAAVDPRNDPRTNDLTEDYLIPNGIMSMMAAPLRLHGQVAGFICCSTVDQPRAWLSDEQDFIASVADLLSLSLETREHQLADEARRESEARYRTLVVTSPDAIIQVDHNLKILFCNQQAADLLGYASVSELIGESGSKFLQKIEKDRVDLYLHILESEGKVQPIEFNLTRKDDSTFPVEVRGSINYGPEHVLNGFTIVLRDITERKQREREQAAIIAVAASLRMTSTRKEIITSVLSDLFYLLQAQGAAFFARVRGSTTYLCEQAVGAYSDWGGHEYVIPDQLFGRSLSVDSGHPINFNAEMFGGGINSAACLPLVIQERVIGALWMGRDERLADNEIHLLSAIADMVATSIHRADLFDETRRQVQRLSTLHNLDMMITASLDLHTILNSVLEQVVNHLNVDAASILLYDGNLRLLRPLARRGFSQLPPEITIRTGNRESPYSLAGEVVNTRRPVSIPDLNRDGRHRQLAQWMINEQLVAYHGVPLISKGEVKGVLEAMHHTPFQADADWQEFLETLAGQAAIAIDNSLLFEEIQSANQELAEAYDTTLEGWARALELRDQETEGHTRRVVELTHALCLRLGMDEATLVQVRRGALLHDIGKLAVPDSILLKPGPLTPEEMEIMRMHPDYAMQMLSPIPYLRPTLDIPYGHHEKWDGSGYPRGLSGTDIPLAARVFAVVDVWDALRSDRPYRPAWSDAETLEYIRRNSGTHFDPEVVRIFLEFVESQPEYKRTAGQNSPAAPTATEPS